jgi:putative aminopeptidase FrvX
MIRKIVKLAVFLLIANGLYQVTPVALHNMQFKDALQQLVLYSQKATDAELVNRAMALADENNIPLEREYVRVRRDAGALHIDATYVEALKLLPRYSYHWQFDIDAQALDLTGPAPRR